jgi:NADPH:quinone reductase
MKAIGVTTFGGPEVLHVFELPEPHAGAGEVRIRVHAASVNGVISRKRKRKS